MRPVPSGTTTGLSRVSFAGVYVTPSIVTVPSQGPVVMAADAGAASTSGAARTQVSASPRAAKRMALSIDPLPLRRDLDLLPRRDRPREPSDREGLRPGEPERCRGLPIQELQGQHAHPDEVAAVDPLVALGDHGPHPEKRRPLGGPVPGRPAAVLLARQHDERDALAPVAECGVVDGHALAARPVG